MTVQTLAPVDVTRYADLMTATATALGGTFSPDRLVDHHGVITTPDVQVKLFAYLPPRGNGWRIAVDGNWPVTVDNVVVCPRAWAGEDQQSLTLNPVQNDTTLIRKIKTYVDTYLVNMYPQMVEKYNVQINDVVNPIDDDQVTDMIQMILYSLYWTGGNATADQIQAKSGYSINTIRKQIKIAYDMGHVLRTKGPDGVWLYRLPTSTVEAFQANEFIPDTDTVEPAVDSSANQPTARKDDDLINDIQLMDFDLVILNSSAGKDSQAMMTHMVQQANDQGFPLDQIHVIHADLGRAEWKGTRQLAQDQATFHGLNNFHVAQRSQGDLLDQVQDRGMWPGPSTRFCTSDHKRDQIATVIRRISRRYLDGTSQSTVRVLNCLGLRAQESSARAKRSPVTINKRLSTRTRTVVEWLPIFTWSDVQVWDTIRTSGCPHHFAYDLGMPRLSCVFCIFAPMDALVLAGRHNPELLDQYVQIESQIDHTFTPSIRMADVRDHVQKGGPTFPIISWAM